MEYIWIARDADDSLFAYEIEPTKFETMFGCGGRNCRVFEFSKNKFSTIKPMECKKFKLVEVIE